MSALPAVAPAATDPAQTEREILTRIARGGLLISEEELYYQLDRHGIDVRLLHDLLGDLQRRGLIESQTHYRLTPPGAELVPAGDRPARAGISPTRWPSAPAAPARDRSRRGAVIAPAAALRGTPAARARASRPTHAPR
jgi:hypothetical protein